MLWKAADEVEKWPPGDLFRSGSERGLVLKRKRVPLLACPAVPTGQKTRHCWTSQQWHPRYDSSAEQGIPDDGSAFPEFDGDPHQRFAGDQARRAGDDDISRRLSRLCFIQIQAQTPPGIGRWTDAPESRRRCPSRWPREAIWNNVWAGTHRPGRTQFPEFPQCSWPRRCSAGVGETFRQKLGDAFPNHGRGGGKFIGAKIGLCGIAASVPVSRSSFFALGGFFRDYTVGCGLRSAFSRPPDRTCGMRTMII